MSRKINDKTEVRDVLRRYPFLCAHIIAESLGYATPSMAARILRDAAHGNENWCEWIFSCYKRDPMVAVRRAIENRHFHRGYMAEIRRAVDLVKEAVQSGSEPLFASWF